MSDAGAAFCKLAKIEWDGIRKSNATAILAQRSRLIWGRKREVRSRGDVFESTGDATPADSPLQPSLTLHGILSHNLNSSSITIGTQYSPQEAAVSSIALFNVSS
ncbi:hypothetical protein N7530_001489 [Penicillium desertorum]|uniref:Uncharacterized protein n=1 Tax=Penicillium desertorum TaxID=1303715 RepID=A0A9W9XAJ7_9EURO|nr:hypothetical protein N7530_001489 [Penicillium desertorum]